MAEKDRIYKCLNPVGTQMPVKTFPLAPRLDTLDGKEIYFSITGEPDITIPLEKKLKDDYPNDRAYNFEAGDLRGIYSVFVSNE